MHRTAFSPNEEVIFRPLIGAKERWHSYGGVTNFSFEILFDRVDSGR
jgi:hypothetical protein